MMATRVSYTSGRNETSSRCSVFNRLLMISMLMLLIAFTFCFLSDDKQCSTSFFQILLKLKSIVEKESNSITPDTDLRSHIQAIDFTREANPDIRMLMDQIKDLSDKFSAIQEVKTGFDPKSQAFIDYQVVLHLIRANTMPISKLFDYIQTPYILPSTTITLVKDGYISTIANAFTRTDIKNVFDLACCNKLYKLEYENDYSMIVFSVKRRFNLFAVRITIPKVG